MDGTTTLDAGHDRSRYTEAELKRRQEAPKPTEES